MTLDPSRLRPATRLVHGGVQRTHHGETAEALFLTSGYVYDDAEQAEATFAGTVDHYQYSRFANPTLTMLEQRLALIEGAEDCRTTATGMAAVNAALLSHLKTGDRVVAARALFGSCHWIVSTLLPKFGIETVFVDGSDLNQWTEALSRPTNLVLLESPSNPMLELVDLPAVADLAHKAGAIVVVDNVFATPLLQQPLKLGADVVVYSCTKHMDGQGRVLGGAVLGTKKWIADVLQPFIRNTGPALSPVQRVGSAERHRDACPAGQCRQRGRGRAGGFPGRTARRHPRLVSDARRPPAARPGVEANDRGWNGRDV